MGSRATETKKPRKTTKRSGLNNKQHNWTQIKIGYLASNELAVSKYLREAWGIDYTKHGTARVMTKAWREEKVRMQLEAINEAKDKIKEIYAPTAEELGELHKGIMTLLKVSIQKELNDCVQFNKATQKQEIVKNPNIPVITKIWEIVKSEKLEPTLVKKISQSLTDEDKILFDKLLDDNL